MLTYIAFGCYFLILVGITWVAYQRTQKLDDYVIGGRQLSPLAAALSAGASDMSGWLLLGLPGYAYASGLVSFWLAAGLFLGSLLNWIYVAPKLRQQTFELGDSITLPTYLENRFTDKSGLLRIVTAIVILVFFTFYTASGLTAGGKLFNTVFGVDYSTAVYIGAAAVLLYTLVGGFLAVSWTDVFQGLLMLVALALIPVLVLTEPQTNPDAVNWSLFTDGGESVGFIAILSLVAWGLGYFGQPHILVRFMALNSVESAKTAKNIAVSWTGASLLLAMSIGMLGAGYFEAPLADSETIFMDLVDALFHPAVAGLLLAAILAAIMSTADSQLLVASSALSEDLLDKSGINLSPKQLLMAGRVAVVLIALVAAYIAGDPEAKVLDMVSYAWAGFGATLGPVVLFSLYYKQTHKLGILAGMILGALTVFAWKQSSDLGGIFALYEIVPGFIVCSLAILSVSKVMNAKAG